MRLPTRTILSLALAGLVVAGPARADVPPDIAAIQNKLANREALTDDEKRRLREWTMRKSNQTEQDIGQTPTDDQNVAMPKDVQEILARARVAGKMSPADQQRLKAWAATVKKNKNGLMNDMRDTARMMQTAPPPDPAQMSRETTSATDNTITVEIQQKSTTTSGELETTGTVTFPVKITVDDNANEKAFHLKFVPNPAGSYRGQLHTSSWGLTKDGKDPAGHPCGEHKDTLDLAASVSGSARDMRASLSGEVVVPAGRRPYTNAQLAMFVTGPAHSTCACNPAGNTDSLQVPPLLPVTLDGLRSDVPFNTAVGDLPVLAAGQGAVDRNSPTLKDTLDQAFFNFDTAGVRRAIEEGGEFSTSSTYHYKMRQGDGTVSSTVTFRFNLKFPEKVCGPDVTDALKRTVAKLTKNFNALADGQKTAACAAAVAPTSMFSWDILGIHDRHEWIEATRPTCDVGGPNPTIEVGGQCFYTGSVNYLLWGVMFRLCAGTRPQGDPGMYNEDTMIEFVSSYKGGLPGVVKESGNWGPSQWWARAGYEGWPAAATPPGDRPKQKCTCPKSMGQNWPSNDGNRTFLIGWFPGLDAALNAP
jgi:hypothetical protein